MTGTTRRVTASARLADLLTAARVIPVLTIERIEDAVPLARALVAGGIKTLEVTLRTAAGLEAARRIMGEVEGAVVGVGTVLSADDAEAVSRAGARFAVSPGATLEVLEAAAELDLPFAPGVETASEVMAALARGFDVLKFFPAVPAGGLAKLRALGGPFPGVRFCPTGGLKEADAATWLKEPNVIAVGGSWLTPKALIDRSDWAGLTEIARKTMTGLV